MKPKLTLSPDDILRARLKTLGVTEYRFTPETSKFIRYLCHYIVLDCPGGGFLSAPSLEWWIYDVGGQRSLVSTFYPVIRLN